MASKHLEDMAMFRDEKRHVRFMRYIQNGKGKVVTYSVLVNFGGLPLNGTRNAV